MNFLRKLVIMLREQPRGGDDVDSMSFGAWADLPPYHPPTSTIESYNDLSRPRMVLQSKRNQYVLPNPLAKNPLTAENEDL
jgi:hypothetical protein